MAEKPYRGTYNPSRKRGEVLKDNVSTGEYFEELDGSDTSGLSRAEKRAAQLNNEIPSSRTKLLEKEMADGVLKKGLVGISKFADRMGFRQEDKYGGKTKEDMAVKKAKGGMVKKSKPKATKSRGDGIAIKGKTKGRMV